MSEYAEKHRTAMREKAHRLAHGDPHQKVDASSWEPPEPLDTEAKTGMRPISQRQYKRGGKVHGAEAKRHAGRKPRKTGGRLVNDLINRNDREANEERPGVKHVGGFKRGGRPGRANGGMSPEEAAASVPTSRMAFQGGESRISRAAGLKRGGKAKHGDEREDEALVRKMVKGDALKRQKRNIGGPLEYLSPALMGLDALGVGRDDKPAKRKGGSVSNGEIEGARPTGGRMARAEGGEAASAGPIGYHIIDRHTGNVVGKTTNSARASTMVVRRDNAYGAYRYHRQPIYSATDWDARHRDQYQPRKDGGAADREAHASGGKAGKGKTNINIVIAQPDHDRQPPMMPMGGPPTPPPMPPHPVMPSPAPPQMGAGPPTLPPGLAGAGPMPPMGRRKGGRVHEEAGSGSGLGRLEKVREYGKEARKLEGHY